MNKKEIAEEIEKLTNYHKLGGGFGDPDAQREHELKIELLKHKQQMIESKKSNYIAIASLIIAIISLLISLFNK
ncbi:hypothetical protein [Pectobacterium carotovorum]|uniref:hypothetical protein n=1 Tax=Pectobacterium carotovorum TaxID=554 RepID=UPI00057DE702|nr:hypothetical protein [Pectobacterium carotovorum]KHT23410.1 hypothetical protein RC96_03035 [Pectobacterium carotovorum subsp. carotovorum]